VRRGGVSQIPTQAAAAAAGSSISRQQGCAAQPLDRGCPGSTCRRLLRAGRRQCTHRRARPATLLLPCCCAELQRHQWPRQIHQRGVAEQRRH
jgi:hypothetical protein